MKAARFISIAQTFSSLLALYSESLSRTYRAATGDSTSSCELSFHADAVGRAAIFLGARVLFLPVFLDQLSLLPAFPFMFAVLVC